MSFESTRLRDLSHHVNGPRADPDFLDLLRHENGGARRERGHVFQVSGVEIALKIEKDRLALRDQSNLLGCRKPGHATRAKQHVDDGCAWAESVTCWRIHLAKDFD